MLTSPYAGVRPWAPAWPSIAPAAPMTTVILSPRWRFGRRALAMRLVCASMERWRPFTGRLLVACEAAAAPTFQDLGDNEVLVVCENEPPVDTLYRVLDSRVDETVLLVNATSCSMTPDPAFPALLAALADPSVTIAAVHDPRRGVLHSPLVCRPIVRFQIEALRDEGCASMDELLRRPFARVVPLD